MSNEPKLGTRANPLICNEWPEAFDTVREAGRPMTCRVGDEIGRCFPSGRYELLCIYTEYP